MIGRDYQNRRTIIMAVVIFLNQLLHTDRSLPQSFICSPHALCASNVDLITPPTRRVVTLLQHCLRLSGTAVHRPT